MLFNSLYDDVLTERMKEPIHVGWQLEHSQHVDPFKFPGTVPLTHCTLGQLLVVPVVFCLVNKTNIDIEQQLLFPKTCSFLQESVRQYKSYFKSPRSFQTEASMLIKLRAGVNI